MPVSNNGCTDCEGIVSADTQDKKAQNTYLVMLFDEIDMLSNVLLSIAYFKRRVGEFWPREAVVQKYNRLSISLGATTRLRRESWTLIDAIYMSKHLPIPDKHCGKRYATVFEGTRERVGRAFHDRAIFSG
jgi:hypothetical protein